MNGQYPSRGPFQQPGPYPQPGYLNNQPVYPGNGLAPRPHEDRDGLSPFGRLAKGGSYGQSSTLLYNAETNGYQPAATDILTLQGDDMDATQLVITLAPPRVIPRAFAAQPLGLQTDSSGSQNNAEVSGDDFPGTSSPIIWPAFNAVLTWGTGGHHTTAVVDWINGSQICVSASFVKLQAAITQSAESGIAGTSAAYSMAAFIGPGWARGGARRTMYMGVVADGDESDVFDVPPQATRAYVVGCDFSQPPVVSSAYVRFFQSSDGVAGGKPTGSFFVSSNQPGTFLVPNGSMFVSLWNQSGIAMKFCVVFELALS